MYLSSVYIVKHKVEFLCSLEGVVEPNQKRVFQALQEDVSLSHDVLLLKKRNTVNIICCQSKTQDSKISRADNVSWRMRLVFKTWPAPYKAVDALCSVFMTWFISAFQRKKKIQSSVFSFIIFFLWRGSFSPPLLSRACSGLLWSLRLNAIGWAFLEGWLLDIQ